VKKKHLASRIGNQLFFTTPTIIVFAFTVLIPFAYGLYLTFMNMPNISSTLTFNGIENYVTAFRDVKFWKAIGLTVQYVLACVILVNVLGFGLGYLVTSGLRGQNFYRTALFTPNMIGGLVMGYIWQFIFVQSLPAIGQRLGIEILRLGWLGDATLAFLAMVIVTIWQMSGYMMLIFIAGFVSLPKDVLEAASIDGANGWKRMRYVTLPLMTPSFVITFFLTLRNCFMVYDINYSLTGGGPYQSTQMASMYIVQKAFMESKFAVGQAEAVILFVIVAVISVIQVSLGKRKEVDA
jgi:raffinose/stachyose/melibiose transport system permease protein